MVRKLRDEVAAGEALQFREVVCLVVRQWTTDAARHDCALSTAVC